MKNAYPEIPGIDLESLAHRGRNSRELGNDERSFRFGLTNDVLHTEGFASSVSQFLKEREQWKHTKWCSCHLGLK